MVKPYRELSASGRRRVSMFLTLQRFDGHRDAMPRYAHEVWVPNRAFEPTWNEQLGEMQDWCRLNVEKGQWSHGEDSTDNPPRAWWVFAFVNLTDAIHFKLRWADVYMGQEGE